MNPTEIDAVLSATLEDRRLTRTEKQALRAVLDERRAGEAVLALFRSRAFELARASVTDLRVREVISWLEDAVQALQPPRPTEGGSRMEAHFSPGEGPLNAIVRLVGEARGSIDVCVFTITDDRITRALLDAWRRGVRLRGPERRKPRPYGPGLR